MGDGGEYRLACFPCVFLLLFIKMISFAYMVFILYGTSLKIFYLELTLSKTVRIFLSCLMRHAIHFVQHFVQDFIQTLSKTIWQDSKRLKKNLFGWFSTWCLFNMAEFELPFFYFWILHLDITSFKTFYLTWQHLRCHYYFLYFKLQLTVTSRWWGWPYFWYLS